MNTKPLLKLSILTTVIAIACINVAAQTQETAGSLAVLGPDGQLKSQCPLKHTAVKAEITGFLSRVVVTQKFENPFKEKIEAVYVFPLPQNAAVDDMTMLVGNRVVRGKILPREQAQAVYEAAKASGQVASLLDQERPNIFTQSVANILPGEKIEITISYVETLKYDNGAYEFVFPMVVAPRYVPGTAPQKRKRGNSFAPNTNQVPDAARITPRPMPLGMRAGHDISLDITLDAGLTIDSVASKSHQVAIERPALGSAKIHLKEQSTIPNKDFILRFDISGSAIRDAVITHRLDKGGFFTMILQPPDRVTVEDVSPKELVFVLDTSGSMGGFPIEKAKETIKLALANLYPSDSFNLITFSGDTHVLFDQPVPASPENLSKAQAFLSSSQGSGGTEMMTAIKAALEPSDRQDHVRIVCFLTDGLVGNDMEIIDEVKKHPNARVFAFGVGESVNRFLLDEISEQGRGEVEYVGLQDDGSAAARRFHERIRNPLLTDISLEWDGLNVSDVYPQRIPDLFSAKPVVLTGRYLNSGDGTLRLKGKMGGNEFVRNIPVHFPENDARHDVLAALWARQRIADLMAQDYTGIQQVTVRPGLRETITQLGMEYRLMTQFTSFVAVEEMVVTDGDQPRRIDVPIEAPEGMVVQEAARGRAWQYKVATPTNLSGFYLPPGPVNGRAQISSVGGSILVPGTSAAGSGQRPSGRLSPPSASSSTITFSGGVSSVQGLFGVDMSPEDKRRAELLNKGDAMIVAIIERLKKQQPNFSVDESRFVVNGKAELQVWLVDKSPATMAELKALGFEVMLDSKASKLVVGRLSIDKLEALLDSKIVRYVAPLLKK